MAVFRQYSDRRANRHANKHVAGPNEMFGFPTTLTTRLHTNGDSETADGELAAREWSHIAVGRKGTAGTDERNPARTPWGSGAFGTINETRATVPMRQLQLASKVRF